MTLTLTLIGGPFDGEPAPDGPAMIVIPVNISGEHARVGEAIAACATYRLSGHRYVYVEDV